MWRCRDERPKDRGDDERKGGDRGIKERMQQLQKSRISSKRRIAGESIDDRIHSRNPEITTLGIELVGNRTMPSK